nr:MAG TPA: Mannosyl-glycoprotein endo-beta-N-acetylglucosaminidase [Crassvirales sp.]
MKDCKHFSWISFLFGVIVGIMLYSAFLLGYVLNIHSVIIKKESMDNIVTRIDTIKKDSVNIALNDDSLLEELQARNIAHPKIVLAQAKLETGNYTSKVYLTHNNLFGLRKADGSYYKFNHWKESVQAYKDYIQYKYQPPSNYYKFLEDIGYAEDKSYTDKLKRIVK